MKGLPAGNEEGVYLAIDFGATHLRIIGTDIDKEYVKSVFYLEVLGKLVDNWFH